MGFYGDMAAMVAGLLAPESAGGLGQGALTLTRVTASPGANPWDMPTTTVESEALRGAVSGVSARFVDGQTVLASDLQAICAVPAMGYQPGDVLEIDGTAATILRVDGIPAAGTRAAVRFIVRR